MVAPKMRRRTAWPGLPDAVRQAFVDLESTVAEAIDRICSWAQPGWSVAHVSSGYNAHPGEIVVAHEACSILIPGADKGNAGARIAVVRDTLGSVVVYPVSGLINGAPSVNPAVNKMCVYVSTGEAWYGYA